MHWRPEHQPKKDDLDVVVELALVCAQIVLQCVYLARVSTHLQDQSQSGTELTTSGWQG